MLHLEQFQREAFQGYIENVPAARNYPLAALMPRKNINDINFAYNVINGSYGQAASVTGWNASAPLRDKKALAREFGSVAKIQHAQRLDEVQLLAFRKPRDEQEQSQALDYVYDTTDELSQGVDDTEEYLRAQAIYTGGISYHDDVNDIHIDFEFDIPAGNRIDSVTTPWSDPAATVLDDLRAAVKQYQSENQRRRPAVMHINGVTEEYLLNNAQIRNQLFGTNSNNQLMTSDGVRSVLRALSLPDYYVNDDVVVTEAGEQPYLEDGKVVLLGNDIGQTMVGPTRENEYASGKFVLPLIEMNPPSETIIVGEAAFPAIQRPQSIVIMNVV